MLFLFHTLNLDVLPYLRVIIYGLCQTNDAMRTKLALSNVGCLSLVGGSVLFAILARSRIRVRPGRDGSKNSEQCLKGWPIVYVIGPIL